VELSEKIRVSVGRKKLGGGAGEEQKAPISGVTRKRLVNVALPRAYK
jgi:hypothetical protein